MLAITTPWTPYLASHLCLVAAPSGLWFRHHNMGTTKDRFDNVVRLLTEYSVPFTFSRLIGIPFLQIVSCRYDCIKYVS